MEITGGAPTVVGAFRVYPATWSVVGGGGLQRSQNKQSLTAQWSANGTSTGAPLAVFVRASDGQMIVQARHAQLRAVGAVKGYQQQTIDGTVKPAGILGLEAFEWTFPQISVAPGGTTASGSLVQPTHGAVAPMQPAGAQGTASCTWQFGRGAVTPPPAVAARAVPVAPR